MQTRQLPTSRFPHFDLNLDIGTIRSIIATCYYPGLEIWLSVGPAFCFYIHAITAQLSTRFLEWRDYRAEPIHFIHFPDELPMTS
jgi:hypothetical protein